MKSVEEIVEKARSARDDDYYQKAYGFMRWFAGDDGLLLGDRYSIESAGSYSGGDMIPDFPYIDVPVGSAGISNHGMVNSRINIQSVVYSDPEFVFEHDDSRVREILSRFIKKRWEDGDWSSVFLECGMEVEVAGIGIAEIGIRNGKVTVEHRSILDTLIDRGHRSRGLWRFIFFRNRLDPDEVAEKYKGIVSVERAKELATDTASSSTVSGLNAMSYGELRQVREWSYWDKDCHMVFLGPIGSESSIMLRLKENQGNYEYEEITDGKSGPNPYGVIPAAIWTDSWMPWVLRPASKIEATYRICRVLNQLEAHLVNSAEREIPITFVATAGMTQAQVEALAKANGPKDIGMVIPIDQADVSRVVNRVGVGGPSAHVISAIQYYKELLSSVTGVADAQRGQPIPGDRTAEEVRTLTSAQGIQNKHLRRQYATFLKDLVNKVRMIAAKYDKVPMTFNVGGITLNSGYFDLKAILEMPIDFTVRESTLVYESEKDKIIQRLQEFQVVDMNAIQLKVADPYKVFMDVYQDLGITDPGSRMVDAETYASAKRFEAQQQAANYMAQGEQQ